MCANNSFKPNLLRYTNNVAGKACHVVGFATQVGLTQALGRSTESMETLLLTIVVAIAFPAGFIAAAMYFVSLNNFGRILESEHPHILPQMRESNVLPQTRFALLYNVLSQVKDGAFRDVRLSQATIDACSSAKRLLYIGMSLFLVVLAGVLLL